MAEKCYYARRLTIYDAFQIAISSNRYLVISEKESVPHAMDM